MNIRTVIVAIVALLLGLAAGLVIAQRNGARQLQLGKAAAARTAVAHISPVLQRLQNGQVAEAQEDLQYYLRATLNKYDLDNTASSESGVELQTRPNKTLDATSL